MQISYLNVHDLSSDIAFLGVVRSGRSNDFSLVLIQLVYQGILFL